MALLSPGVEVTIIDESQYAPASAGTIPFFLIATAQNKAQPNGVTVASATTLANANKLYAVTSQRDLVTLYGTPFFYTTVAGTPIQGYELNEYGLLAAYSALGLCNRIYVLRADVNLASLIGQAGRPSGAPTDGSYWLNTTSTTWGIYEWNATTGKFTQKTPIVIVDSDNLIGGYPSPTLGSVGSYAVNAIPSVPNNTPSLTPVQWFYKNSSNIWTAIGASDWANSWPIVQGTATLPTFTNGDSITINLNNKFSKTFTAGASPNNNIQWLTTQINNLGLSSLIANSINGKFVLYSAQIESTNKNSFVGITGTGTFLADLGVSTGNYFVPTIFAGPSSKQPLWASSQTTPRPTGSVWLKTSSSGNGFTPEFYRYNAITRSWEPKIVNSVTSFQNATETLAAGGLASGIPQGTIASIYNFVSVPNNYQTYNSPYFFIERSTTGATIVTGSVSNPSFTTGPYEITVVPTDENNQYSASYTINLADNTFAEDFVDAWVAAAIPYTTASVDTTGNIVITHTLGGDILLNDIFTTGPSVGNSSGFLSIAGFIPQSTEYVSLGSLYPQEFVVTQSTTSGVGIDLSLTISTMNGTYLLGPQGDNPYLISSGSGYAVNDTITFNGSKFGGSVGNNLILKVISVGIGGSVTGLGIVSGTAPASYNTILSNWVFATYEANEGAPVANPSDGTNWYYSVEDQVDIMVNYNGAWKGYKNQNYDINGFPTPSGSNSTDPNGPIISASEPTVQTDGTPLVYGDIWIDTSDLENYPIISRYQLVDSEDKWVLIDNTDQTSGSGVLFADARWATNGTTNPVNDPLPTIKSLLTSNYLDLDAPSSESYPVGMLLFNTRRSGFNVKQFKVNYFNNTRFPDQILPTQKDAWVTISGNQTNGAAYMGRKAQRAVVVQSLRSAIDTNFDVRDESFPFTLMATPNYPELQQNMIVLNADRGDTAFIVGDTPMRLSDSATAISSWAINLAGASSTGEDGLVNRSTYMGLFYPSGLAPDFEGNLVAVPPSHMMMRTIIRSDQLSYPWFAPAGTRRGLIDNATALGYVSPETGEFVTVRTRVGIRDVLYENSINPLVFFSGQGLLNFGNKASFASQSALDRVNVARLINYVRRQLVLLCRPFIFEPNDAFTRSQVQNTISGLMNELVSLRGIYDYSVICDDSNNTPTRIDRNELWVDVALQPVKAIEFIYVPVRILNTGETVTSNV